MKVVQINSACKQGSTGKIVIGISSLMCENDIENIIYYSGNHKCDIKNSVVINSKFDIRIHQMLSRIFGDQGWHSVLSTQRLIKNIKKFNPDVIHLHNLHGYYLNMTILFDFLSRIDTPIIWTLHDCWAFTGHCTHFTSQKCNKWIHECSRCPQRKAYPYSWFWDRSKYLFGKKEKLYSEITNLTITVVSNWLKDMVGQSKLLGNRNICVIPNGIDLSIFKPGKKLSKINGIDISSKKVLLGVANNWGKSKGYEDFCKLASMISNDWMIVMVGLSEQQINKIPNNVIGMNRTDNISQLVDLYTTAIAYFSASTEETFGLTILEAMACGTPAIVYNSTACPELISDKNGFVIESHSLDDVVDKLKVIEKVGKKYYEKECLKFVQEFQDHSIYDKYLELYRNEVMLNDPKAETII